MRSVWLVKLESHGYSMKRVWLGFVDVRPYIVCCIVRNLDLQKSLNIFKHFITLQVINDLFHVKTGCKIFVVVISKEALPSTSPGKDLKACFSVACLMSILFISHILGSIIMFHQVAIYLLNDNRLIHINTCCTFISDQATRHSLCQASSSYDSYTWLSVPQAAPCVWCTTTCSYASK